MTIPPNTDYAWVLTPLQEAFGADRVKLLPEPDGTIWIHASNPDAGLATKFCLDRPDHRVNEKIFTARDKAEYLSGTMHALKTKIFQTT